MYLQTSRLQYNLQGVVLLQTAFSKIKFGFHRMVIVPQTWRYCNLPVCTAVNKEKGIEKRRGKWYNIDIKTVIKR